MDHSIGFVEARGEGFLKQYGLPKGRDSLDPIRMRPGGGTQDDEVGIGFLDALLCVGVDA